MPDPALLSPEALLTWDSVRRLELHTDIGPGKVGPLLIQANFSEHKYRVNLLREAGFLTGGSDLNPTGATGSNAQSEGSS